MGKNTGVTSTGISNMGDSSSLTKELLSNNSLGTKYSAIKSLIQNCNSLRILELDNSDIGGGGLEVVRAVPYSSLTVLSIYQASCSNGKSIAISLRDCGSLNE